MARLPKDPSEALARRMLREAKDAGWRRATVRVGGIELIVDDSDAAAVQEDASPFDAWKKNRAHQA